MKKIIFCIMILRTLSLFGMHEQQGPYAYALFKKIICYSGFCSCGASGCQYKQKQFIPQEKVEYVTKKLSPLNRTWRD